jgi:hypothetical protein
MMGMVYSGLQAWLPVTVGPSPTIPDVTLTLLSSSLIPLLKNKRYKFLYAPENPSIENINNLFAIYGHIQYGE